MKLYGAIDLHSNNNVTVLINEQDRVVFFPPLALVVPEKTVGTTPCPGTSAPT